MGDKQPFLSLYDMERLRTLPYGISMTIQYHPARIGFNYTWSCRVDAANGDDWSGNHESFELAIEAGKKRIKDILEKHTWVKK